MKETKIVRINFEVPEDIRKEFKRQAMRREMTMKDFLLKKIYDFLKTTRR